MTFIKYTLFCLITVFLMASYFSSYTPLLIPIVFLLMSALSFILYAKDKRAARLGEWRIPENTLQLFSLLAGWPGAIMAQQVLRHKTLKVSFQIGFFFVTFINIGPLVWLHTSDGFSTLQTFISALENFITSEFAANKLSNGLFYLLQYRSVI